MINKHPRVTVLDSALGGLVKLIEIQSDDATLLSVVMPDSLTGQPINHHFHVKDKLEAVRLYERMADFLKRNPERVAPWSENNS